MVKQKTKLSESGFKPNHNHTHTLLWLGAIAGVLIGAGSALALAPQRGRNIRQGLYDAYCDLACKAGDVKENVFKQGGDFLSSAQTWKKKSCPVCSNTSILIGGASGALLGAATVFLLSQNAGKDTRDFFERLSDRAQDFAEHLREPAQSISENVRDKAECWINKVTNVLDALHQAKDEHNEDEEEDENESSASSKIHHIVDLATLGLRLFKSLKKGR